MSDPGQPPTADTDSRSPLVRTGLSAVALVAVVSLAFWGIGSVRDEAGTPVVAEDPADTPAEEPEAAEEPEPTEEPDPAPDDEPEDEPGDEPDEVEDDPDDVEDGDDPDDTDGSPDGDEDGDDGPRAVAPGDVTIQVLDGAKSDGGTAADEVADRLTEVGYAIVARNDALTYDVTTVLYNPGYEEAAEQVAADLGGAEVRPQPGNLSSGPSLHVVVGLDRL